MAKSSHRKRAHHRKKDPDLVAFGNRLRELRASADLTQEGLAHAAGLHWSYIGQIERGERNLSYINIRKLARGLGVTVAEMLPDD
jgi:transcriptional regulator with XRE-family HTH domain